VPNANPSYPDTNYPGTSPGSGYPNTGYPGTPSGNGYPNTGAPNNGYPNTGAPTDGYPNTGAPNNGDLNTGAPTTNGYPNTVAYPGVPGAGGNCIPDATGSCAQSSAPPSLYAGFAYEIHTTDAGGYDQQVDPATHAFRTGDRFKVIYRPSLPGQVDVYNINAAGQNTHIDTISVAAGQLAELGPYEFTDLRGNETLILSLAPCSTAALMTATRNIVKVPAGAAGNGSFNLSQCGGPATRGLRVKTRDIRKVAVEGGTSFGLDPLSPTEITSGDVAPRQITISLQHQ
jgi:hypothetical protein